MMTHGDVLVVCMLITYATSMHVYRYIVDKVSPVFCVSNFGDIKLSHLCKLLAAFCVIGSTVAVE